ncbi:MAG: helix-turn-helix transcriptional regulator [Enterocloster asparagiformis]|nr:helix-turn-helix transcriptional regulator [Enterocloster asparagiformis]
MFGQNLRIARKSKGYTLEELSELYNDTFGAGMNKGTLSKYENGKQEPMITVVANLATLLNIPIDFLLDTESLKINRRLIYSDFTDFEQKLLLQYRNAPDLDKEMVCRILKIKREENYAERNVSLQSPVKSHLTPIAAHTRTDIPKEDHTKALLDQEDDIMNDPNF